MLLLLDGFTQANSVFSGGEVVNFGIVDISLTGGQAWRTERSNQPGYFSSMTNAIYSGYSDQSNIDGYVKKIGNTAFLFPVGTGNDLRTLEISQPGNITDAYATAWIEGDPSNNLDPTTPGKGKHAVVSVTAPIVSVSKVGQWDWQVGEFENLGSGTTGNGDGLLIKISIPDMAQFAEAAELRMVGWNGSSWIDLSGKPTATGNKENSTISGKMIKGISAIAIGKTKPNDPIKLKSFSSNSFNCKTILNWETSIEKNSGIFIVERGYDNLSFKSIASIDITGSSNGNSYSKTVEQPVGKAYYRLKIKDINGNVNYSPTISYNNNCHAISDILLYPNPTLVNQNILMRFITSYAGKAEILIVDNLGQVKKTSSVYLSAGLNKISPDIKNILQGTYFIKLVDFNGNQLGNANQLIIQ